MSYGRCVLWFGLVSSFFALAGCGPDYAAIHKKANEHLEAGKTALKAGQFDAAIKEFDETIKLDPDNVQAHMDRGTAFLNQGDNVQAIASYDEAARHNPGFPENLRLRANAKFRLGDLTGALQDAEAAAANPYASINVLLTLSSFQTEAGLYDEAIATCATLIDKYPYPPPVDGLINRGEAYRLKKDFAKAEADFRTVLAQQPGNLMARTNLGANFRDQGEFDKSKAELNEALRVNGDYAHAWYQLGWVHHDLKDYTGVVSCWHRTNALTPRGHFYQNIYARFLVECPRPDCHDPNSALPYATKACELTQFKKPEYLDTLAAVHAANGEFVKAAETQAKAIALWPSGSKQLPRSEALRHFYQGQAAATSGKTDEALKAFAAAKLADPGHIPVHVAASAVYVVAGDLPKALAACDEALQLDAKSFTALRQRAIVKHKQDDLVAAIQDAESALRIQPTYLDGILTLIPLQIEAQAYDAAIANCTLALSWMTSNVEAHRWRGEAQRLKKEYAKAAQDFDQAILIKPEFAAAHASRATLYHQQGDAAKAIESQKKAIELLPKESKLRPEYEATLKKYEQPAETKPMEEK